MFFLKKLIIYFIFLRSNCHKVTCNSFIYETFELVSYHIGKIGESLASFYFAYFFNEIKYNKIFTISKTKKAHFREPFRLLTQNN